MGRAARTFAGEHRWEASIAAFTAVVADALGSGALGSAGAVLQHLGGGGPRDHGVAGELGNQRERRDDA